MDLESRESLVWYICPKLPHKSAINLLPGSVVSFERLTGGGWLFKVTHKAFGMLLFFSGLSTRGPGILLAVDQRPPSALCHINLSTGCSQMASYSFRAGKRKSKNVWTRWKVTIFYFNLIVEMALHHIATFIHSKQVGRSSHIHREDIINQGHRNQESEILRGSFRGWLPVCYYLT